MLKFQADSQKQETINTSLKELTDLFTFTTQRANLNTQQNPKLLQQTWTESYKANTFLL